MITVSVDPTKRHQKIQGFGASGCWWASNWPSHNWSEQWIDEAIACLYDPIHGIGLNTYRHNIGAGSNGSKILPARETRSIEKEPGIFDLSLDMVNQKVLDKVLAYPNVDCLTLFINSPPGRMTITGEPNGNPTRESNLKNDCLEAFVRYTVDAVMAYLNAGYPVTYISPVNEPQWDWSACIQEGTFYSVEQVMQICRGVAEGLKQRCPSVRLSMPDSARWNHPYVYEILQRLAHEPELLQKIDHICGHSYAATTEDRKALAQYLSDLDLPLSLHQTEWCEEENLAETDMEHALILGRTLHEDLSILNVPRWEFWKAIENIASYWQRGLIALPFEAEETAIKVPKRTWLLGQYSRFVTHGTRIHLELTDSPATVYGTAYEKNGSIILVLTNETEKPAMIHFQNMPYVRGNIWQTSDIHDLASLGTINLSVGYSLPGKSITTLVLES